MSMADKARKVGALLQRGGLPALWRHADAYRRTHWNQWKGRRLNRTRGWRSPHPVLVIESDDWGSEHVADPDALEALRRAGSPVADSYLAYDALETPDDVDRLRDVLCAHRDSTGRPAVMTANVVMANADFRRIAVDGCRTFSALPIDQGWNHQSDGQALWQSYRRAVECGAWVPQLHGFVHFRPEAWMARLRNGDRATLAAFERCMIGEDANADGIGLQSMGPIYLGDPDEIRRLVADGVAAFERAFGKKCLTTIAPCYAWRSPSTEEALAAHGIRALQGRAYQYMPEGAPRFHYLGQRGPAGVIYLTRTCLLETIPAGTTVEQCLAEISAAFAARIPAVLSSHRVNYTSRVSSRARGRGLAVLDGVLRECVKRFPTLEFLSSEDLARRILSTTAASASGDGSR